VIVSQQGRRTVGAEIKLLRDEYTYDEEVRWELDVTNVAETTDRPENQLTATCPEDNKYCWSLSQQEEEMEQNGRTNPKQTDGADLLT
jgi:hypothetical protein